MLFNGRNNAIKVVDNYSSMILEAKRKATEGEPELKPLKAKTRLKKVPLELCEEFINEINFVETISMSKYLKNIFLSNSIIFSKRII